MLHKIKTAIVRFVTTVKNAVVAVYSWIRQPEVHETLEQAASLVLAVLPVGRVFRVLTVLRTVLRMLPQMLQLLDRLLKGDEPPPLSAVA